MFRTFVLLCCFSFVFSDPSEFIVGGRDATPGQFPYQASLRNQASNNIHFCMGVILNSRWVATTIRCVFWRLPIENILVIVDSQRLGTGGRSYQASRFVDHPDYRSNGFKTYENDVSLVQIQGNIVFSSTVQPIALSSDVIGGGINVIISGFGLASDANTEFNDVLQYLRTTTLTNSDAQSRMPEFMYGEITERTFCTFASQGQGICRGVTGSAVVHNDRVAGLVSFGQITARCGVWPDCHVRISHPAIRSWILSVIESN